MPLVPTGIPLALAAAEALIGAILIRPRNIAGFVADVTIEEIHRDRLTLTHHPVEQGAAITDHSYKEPAEVIIRAGFSNSSLNAGGDPNYVQEVYNQFLTLQASRQPFAIVTGKRSYQNMLITLLQVTTDQRSENALMMTAECREIIIAETQIVTVGSTANMTNPQLNGAVQPAGAVALGPANQNNFNANPPAN